MTTTYLVDILGKLWMGGTAAISHEYKVGDGPFCQIDKATFETVNSDLTGDYDAEADMIADYVDTHEGDFAEIVALRVIRYSTVTDTHENQQGGRVSTIVTTKTVTTLREFEDDEFTQWCDCLPGEWEEMAQ